MAGKERKGGRYEGLLCCDLIGKCRERKCVRGGEGRLGWVGVGEDAGVGREDIEGGGVMWAKSQLIFMS